MSPAEDRSHWSEREHARRAAAIAANRLSTGVLLYGAFEALAAVVDTFAAASASMDIIAAIGRALFAAALALTLRGFGPWARAQGLGAWSAGALLLAFVSLLLFMVPVVGLGPPQSLSPDLWVSLVNVLALTLLVGALALTILMTARFAARADLPATARVLVWSILSPASALIAGLVVIHPAIFPTPWIGPIAPLVALSMQSAARIVPWGRSLPVNMFTFLLGGLLWAMDVPFEYVALVGALAGIAIAAVMPRGQLADVTSVLSEEPQAGPSRTFIRRLLDGPTESQIAMDVRLGSQASATDEAESLALAYRELGIVPPKAKPKPIAAASVPAVAATATVPAPLPASPPAPAKPDLAPLPRMAKLEPVSKTGSRPALALPHDARADAAAAATLTAGPFAGAEDGAWARASEALRFVFLGFIARTATAVFGFMLMRAPIARELWVQLGGVAVLVVASAMIASGLYRFGRELPAAGHRAGAVAAAALAAIVGLSDLGLAVAIVAAPELVAVFGIASASGFLVVLIAMLIVFARLFRVLGQPGARSRVATVGVELSVFTALALAAIVASQSAESDVAWLAYPAVVGAGLAGFVLFATFLWLIHDLRTLLIDWQVRMRRAKNPELTSEDP